MCVDGHGQRLRDAAERLAEAVRRITLGTELAKHLNDAHQAVGVRRDSAMESVQDVRLGVAVTTICDN